MILLHTFVENVASMKSTQQSSTIEGDTSDLAVNGITEGFGDYTQTRSEPGQWWMVDLEKEWMITVIILHTSFKENGNHLISYF